MMGEPPASVTPNVLHPAGFSAYDLTPPGRLLYPGTGHRRRGYTTRTLRLGDGPTAATITVDAWAGCTSACAAGPPHEPGTKATLTVPCSQLPHCQACECDDAHTYTLTDAEAATLKGMLP